MQTEHFPRDIVSALDGQFELQRELGRGGMGVVYLAHDVKLDRAVAIKILPPHLAAEPETRERFLREARTAAHLAHPNVVPVHRADEIAGYAFFVMAFVEGESLAERLAARGPFPPADAVRVVRDVAWALAYAHARGVVHRDIKPENILIERATNRVMVGDFGIARQIEASRLTQDGLVIGTVHYMSPEQVNGLQLDGRSDLYSLGVVTYQLLSGRLPFEGLTVPSILAAHIAKPAPSLASVAPTVPLRLAQVVDRCLAKQPEHRFRDCEELAEALEAAVDGIDAAIVLPAGFPGVLSESQAAKLWKRAAQLQADALDRLERSRAPLSTGESTTPSDGYRVEQVTAAAEEAGISRRYVAMALAEMHERRPADDLTPAPKVSSRSRRLFLGTDQRSLSVSAIIAASPARTLRALGTALQQQPYDLRVGEIIGAHPLDGGVLVLDLPGPIVRVSQPRRLVNFYWMGTHQQLEARQIQLTLRGLAGGGQSDRCEVTMTCDLRAGARTNVAAAKWMAGVFGSLGGLAAGAVFTKAVVVTAGLVLGPAVLAGGVIAGATLAWYRWLYPRTLEKARQEMLGALEAVARAVRSEELFGVLPPPGQAQVAMRGSDGSEGAVIASLMG